MSFSREGITRVDFLLPEFPGHEVLDLRSENKFDEKQMIKIIRSKKNIRIVFADGQILLKDKVITVIAERYSHKLVHLDLARCSQVTSAGLRVLLSKCAKLTYLNLFGCRVEGDLASLFKKHSSLKTVVFPSGREEHYNREISEDGLEDGMRLLSLAPGENKNEFRGDVKLRGVVHDGIEGGIRAHSIDYSAQVDHQDFKSAHKKGRGVWKLASFEGLVLSASYDHSLGVWNPKTRELVARLEGVHKREILDVIVIPGEDGGFMTGSSEGTIVVWDRNYQQRQVIKEHKSGVYSLARLASGSIVSGPCQCPPNKVRWDYDMRIWDPTSGRRIGTLRGHEGAVASLDVMEDGTLLSASADKTVKMWDVAAGVCLRTFTFHKDYVYCVKSLGLGRFASASRDRSIMIWDSRDNSIKKLEGHTSTVYSLCPIGDHLLVSGSRDGSVTIWDLRNGKYLNVLECPGEFVYSILAGEGGEIIAGLSSGKLFLWKFPVISL